MSREVAQHSMDPVPTLHLLCMRSWERWRDDGWRGDNEWNCDGRWCSSLSFSNRLIDLPCLLACTPSRMVHAALQVLSHHWCVHALQGMGATAGTAMTAVAGMAATIAAASSTSTS